MEPSTISAPADLVQQAIRANRAVVEAEALAAAVNISPAGFEHLVAQLFTTMGYDQRGSLEHTPLGNDGGIDGIISQDPLGLGRIYV